MLDTIITIIEVMGVVSFSISGSIVAIDKEMDFIGVIFLAMITSFGGGVMRDLIIGRTPAFFVSMPLYVIISIVTSVTVFVLASVFKRLYVKEEDFVTYINNFIDALGIGAFTVSSVRLCLDICPEKGAFLAIMMGMIASIGGGMVRDVCLRDIPFVFRKRIYALASLAGAVLYYFVAVCAFGGSEVGEVVASVCGILLVFLIRVFATVFKWNMPKAINFKKIQNEPESVCDVKEADKDSLSSVIK